MAQHDYVRTALRVPPELHRAIHEAAEASGRTFNAEILHRLETTFLADRYNTDMSVAMKDPETRRQAVAGLLDEMIAMAQHRYPGLWVDPKDLKVNEARPAGKPSKR